MRYENIMEGRFISRPNRFIAEVEICGSVQRCHVKNTGRCRELLIPGAQVLLEKSTNPNRKTGYSLISVYKGGRLVNIDSQAPNRAVEEWIKNGGLGENVAALKAEVYYKSSRFDFCAKMGRETRFIEVKGVTLEEDGTALFPDAPTERGVKHLRELMDCVENGLEAQVIFVIQMAGVYCFRPNARTHLEFAQALKEAAMAGVQVCAYSCSVDRDSMVIDRPVPVILQ